MELQKTKHQQLLEEWKIRVHACGVSSMTVKAWCEKEGIVPQTYYRWQKLIREAGTGGFLACAAHQEVSFVEYQTPVISSKGSGSVVVHLTCGSVEIQNGAEKETISATLQVLKSLC